MLINCSWLTQTHTHLRTHTYIGTQHHTHSNSLSHTRTILCCRYFCNICIIAFVAFILSVLAQRGMCQIFAQHSPSPPLLSLQHHPLVSPLSPFAMHSQAVRRLRETPPVLRSRNFWPISHKLQLQLQSTLQSTSSHTH